MRVAINLGFRAETSTRYPRSARRAADVFGASPNPEEETLPGWRWRRRQPLSRLSEIRGGSGNRSLRARRDQQLSWLVFPNELVLVVASSTKYNRQFHYTLIALLRR